ncbi:hypothetical protein [Providencia rettgeri]|uniref:hypothetical protein n=1 Tax=Providencia rettgeri TaxID=587 RepID=UPI00301A241D
MSSKINIFYLIKGHLNTLRSADNHRLSWSDIATFFIVPAAIAYLIVIIGLGINKDLISILVNFSAIITALLLSVLVLVYEQGNKLREKAPKDKSALDNAKEILLDAIYYNICYSILSGALLITLCFIISLTYSKIGFLFNSETLITALVCIKKYIIVPVIIFLFIHLLLNIIMIVKRMHVLLTK